MPRPTAPGGRWHAIRSFSNRASPGCSLLATFRHGSIKRVASAVGEGAMSIALVHSYLATLDRQ